MGTKVLTHDRFGGDALRERLRASGVEVEDRLSDAQRAEMKLPEPQYGETIVGELTEEEAAAFHALYRARREWEETLFSRTGKEVVKLGNDLQDAEARERLMNQHQNGQVQIAFEDDAEAERFFRAERQAQYLNTVFYFMIGERLGQHRHKIGIRSRLRVVTVERRY